MSAKTSPATQKVPNTDFDFNALTRERVQKSKKNLDAFLALSKEGGVLPDVTLSGVCGKQTRPYSLAKEFQGKRVVLLTIPFAFSDVARTELLRIIPLHDLYKSQKIDRIACIVIGSIGSVWQWSQAIDPQGHLLMLSDPHGDYIEKIGMGKDITKWGLDFCSEHSFILLEDRRVRYFAIEPTIKKVSCTKAEKMYAKCAELHATRLLSPVKKEEGKDEVFSPLAFKSETTGKLQEQMKKLCSKVVQAKSKLPDVMLKLQNEKSMEDVPLSRIISNKRVLLFTLPSAFHLGALECVEKYLKHEAGFTSEKIICLVTDMRYSLSTWHIMSGFKEKVTFYSDWRYEFTLKSGLGCDGIESGLGFVLRPTCMIVEKGIIQEMQVAKDLKDLTALDPELLMKTLKAQFKSIALDEGKHGVKV